MLDYLHRSVEDGVVRSALASQWRLFYNGSIPPVRAFARA